MLPSAGHSHSCVCQLLWFISAALWCSVQPRGQPKHLGISCHGCWCAATAWTLERVSFCSWLTSIFSPPSGFAVTPWQCHQESPGSLTAPLHSWEMRDVTDLKACSWLPNPSCPSNSTTVTFSLSFTRKSCGIRNAMLLPSGEDWESVKPGRASVMVCPDLQHGGGQRGQIHPEDEHRNLPWGYGIPKSSTTFISDITFVPMASH